MPRFHLRLPRRRALVIGAAVAAAVIVVVVSNQPASAPTEPRVAAATTTSPAPGGSGSTIGLDQAPTPVHSGLRVLHAHYAFRDAAAEHPGAPTIDVAGGVLIDVDAGEILWAKGAHSALPPASTTKIVSALVALENLDPEAVVNVTPDALLAAEDETKLGVEAGDHYTVTELLEAMLTISANDAADVMAVDTVGMPRYVAAMNEQLAALGLRDSHFDSPVGLDSPTQRASPYDLAVAGLAAYDNFPLFREIVGQPQIDVPATSGHVQYTLHNLNRLLQMYPPTKGIKPGWTGDAGYCLVALAEREGHRLVLVLMNEPRLYEDARTMFEWGFGQLGIAPLASPTPSPTPKPHR